MKKHLLHILILLAFTGLGAFAASCTDDDDKIVEEEDDPYPNEKFLADYETYVTIGEQTQRWDMAIYPDGNSDRDILMQLNGYEFLGYVYDVSLFLNSGKLYYDDKEYDHFKSAGHLVDPHLQIKMKLVNHSAPYDTLLLEIDAEKYW